MAKILIIDDDDGMRGMLRDVLTMLGHDVRESATGAIAPAAQRPLDLAFVDVFMPEIDGFETLRRFRREAPEVPIVMMTGDPLFRGMDVLTVARAAGARDVLVKPVPLDTLRRCLREIVGGA